MHAITVTQPGGPEQLVLSEVPDPAPAADEVLIRVAAAGINRADLLQRQGHYPPPPGASPILGMECAGTVVAVGEQVRDWKPGDRVCALLAGGGYAELVTVPAVAVLPQPESLSAAQAAALPEVTCTVWSNLVMTAGLRSGQTVLIHGGGSGIGTMAIQIGKALGARVAVTASRPDTLAACRGLGADVLIDYQHDDFAAILQDIGGADVILDVVGAKYLSRNVSALADGGRLVVIGMQGGARAELDLGALLAKRAGVIATALRSRPVTGTGSKAEIVAAVRDRVWPMIASGTVRPVIDSQLPLQQAADAHRRMEAGGHLGKIVLTVD